MDECRAAGTTLPSSRPSSCGSRNSPTRPRSSRSGCRFKTSGSTWRPCLWAETSPNSCLRSEQTSGCVSPVTSSPRLVVAMPTCKQLSCGLMLDVRSSGGETFPEHRQVLAEDHAASARASQRRAVLRGRRDAQPGAAHVPLSNTTML